MRNADASTPPTQPPVDDEASRPTPRRRLVRPLAVLVALAAGLGYLAWRYPSEARNIRESIVGKGRTKQSPTLAERPSQIGRSWNGLIKLSAQKRKVMGISTVKVAPQTDPIRLELLGTTDYITETLTKIRPMFEGRVDKVHVALNQAVKKDDPLVDFYSKDLAEAKSAYEIDRIQWVFDKNLLDTHTALVESKAISDLQFRQTQNNEMKSRRQYEVARDNLFVYGLSEADIEKVPSESGAQKARMTLRSPTDGFVIEREVVKGNLYDEKDTLLTIAPLDRLWVWGDVFESDLDLVRLGQLWEIRFPFLEQKLRGKVEYISNRVDPNSRAVRVRTSIPNPGRGLKSDMLVRSMLEIPPVPGRTVIPRTALIVDDNGRYEVFVQVAGKPDTFEMRVVAVAQEKDDHAILDRGLKAGEAVVSVGGLILSQIYEDSSTDETGR